MQVKDLASWLFSLNNLVVTKALRVFGKNRKNNYSLTKTPFPKTYMKI